MNGFWYITVFQAIEIIMFNKCNICTCIGTICSCISSCTFLKDVTGTEETWFEVWILTTNYKKNIRPKIITIKILY